MRRLCGLRNGDRSRVEGEHDEIFGERVAHSIAVENSKLIEAVSGGWPRILSNLKSLIETDEVILPPKQ